MICKNCNEEFEGKYCNYCGQHSTINRINWKYLTNSIADNVFQINHGFLYTVKILLFNPGQSLKNFFVGKRKKFYEPFAFLLLSTTIFLLSTKLLGNETFIDDFVRGINKASNESSDKLFNLKIFDFLKNNQTYVFLFIVPLFSISSFISFRKSKYNFSEHLILNLYITGEQLLIYSIFSFIKDRDSLMILLPLILGLSYNLYVYNRFFDKLNWFNRNLKLLLSYFIYLILLNFSLMIIMILIITTANTIQT